MTDMLYILFPAYDTLSNIVNDITNFCFRLLQEPYTVASAKLKTKFPISLTIKNPTCNMITHGTNLLRGTTQFPVLTA